MKQSCNWKFQIIPVTLHRIKKGASVSLITSTALTQMKTTTSAVIIGVGLMLVPLDGEANPISGTVVEGGATIVQETATKLGITQHTSKAIINWQSFDIQGNEHTQFYQPSAVAFALNRVVGGDPSEILGRLTANGRIMIINPDGILFGRNSRVDVAALTASTHDIRNEDFMMGNLDFSIPGNPNASIINQGSISVADKGVATLVASGVRNSGVIVARLGKVQLAAANGFTLDLYGDGLINFIVDEKVAATALDRDGKPLNALVENDGRISADGGYVVLTAAAARDVVNNVVNSSGVIEAKTFGNQNGEIILHGGDSGVVSVTGTLDASGKEAGQTGGRVQVTGEKVGLFTTPVLMFQVTLEAARP